MPIYMDVHIVPGVKAIDVAQAHQKDLMIQDEHTCKCMTYWVDEKRESIFCLIEAPDKIAVQEMHRRAHGLIPHKIIEVSDTLVESFLGRIYDPVDAQITDEGLKVFSEPSFRTIMITQITDPVLLKNTLGKDKAGRLLQIHTETIRRKLEEFGGKEAEHDGSGFICSFTSAAKALACACATMEELSSIADTLGFKIGINAGEPIAKNDKLFGDTIQMAQQICATAPNSYVAISSAVKDLVSKDQPLNRNNILTHAPQDENLLQSLYSKLEAQWQNPDYSVDDFSKDMAMSQSQLYRKTTELFNLSPNLLMKEFRLEKAKELLKQQRYSISQITFDSGFTSPSYFTKCFKSKYGLLPMEYIDLLH
ncbi:MAG: nickel-binding protein [Flavisolibacter sp.]